jgi:hypothetical protein
MTKKSTKRNLRIFVFILFLLPLGAFAQTTPSAYLCGTGTVKLTPAFPNSYTPPTTGYNVVWSVNGTPEAAKPYTGPADLIYNISPTLAPGNYKYTVQLVPIDNTLCPSDASDVIEIEKLPVPVIAITNSGGNTVCTDNSAATILTANQTTPATLPSGVTMTYAWTATFGGAAVTDITTLGTKSTSGDTFTLNTGVAPGAYVFTAVGSYATGGIQIVPATTCTASASQSITVTPKPGKPTVGVAP